MLHKVSIKMRRAVNCCDFNKSGMCHRYIFIGCRFFYLLINYSVELNGNFTTATTFYFMNFFSYVKHLPKIWPLKKPQVKVKSRSKVIRAFVFFLWRHLWQTVRIAANFLHNSSLSKNTRFSRCAKFSFSQ